MFAPTDIDLCAILVLSILLVDVVVVDGILNSAPPIVHVTRTGKSCQENLYLSPFDMGRIYIPSVEALEELFAGPLAIVTAPDDDDTLPVVGC